MAITSANKSKGLINYRSNQFRYALIYVVITFFVLLILNIYTSKISQELFYKSKETSMVEKCQLAANAIADLDVINPSSVSNALSSMDTLRQSRLIFTDQTGLVIHDSTPSDSLEDKYLILPEVLQALSGNDVFSWNYQDGLMRSRAAVPVYSYGALVGCVYILENDAQQGALIQSLQTNIFMITMTLEAVIILFSFVSSRIFTGRLRKIMDFIGIVREGDYSKSIKLRGRDELSVLSEEFNSLTTKLDSSEQKRRQFVSDASHELKTPLASIKLLSDSILQNDMDMVTVREFVSDIGNEAERLNRMSQKLLTLSKNESKFDGEYEIVNIAPTVEKVVRMLNAIAEDNRICITTDLTNDSPILVIDDDLHQIIFNLAENGIKYNLPGGSLNISLKRVADDAQIIFADTGVGIPSDSLEDIFERFYRVDKARSRKSGGSGLGLSIVKDMVERNRGKITVESVVNKGTTFTVSFPIFDTEEDTV